MYLDPCVSINCKYKIIKNIRLDHLTGTKLINQFENITLLANRSMQNTTVNVDITGLIPYLVAVLFQLMNTAK